MQLTWAHLQCVQVQKLINSHNPFMPNAASMEHNKHNIKLDINDCMYKTKMHAHSVCSRYTIMSSSSSKTFPTKCRFSNSAKSKL